MGFLDSIFGAERRAANSGDDFWYTVAGMGTETNSGVRVNDASAMRSASVFACVRVLAESVASLPIHVYKRLPDGGKQRATNHPAYKLLHREINPQMTAYQWVETAMFHMALTGNHYSEIVYTNRGEIGALVPWNPEKTTVNETKSGKLEYKLDLGNGKPKTRPAEKMLHIPAFAWNGIQGLSTIAYARETIGMSLAAEEFGARFFGHGMNPGHIMTLGEGQRFDEEQTQKFLKDLREKHSGLGKSHNNLVLPSGMTVSPIGIPPDDAQWIDSRRFSVEEIARIFRVPLHMIGEHTKNTSWGSGIEQMTLGYVTYTLRPWMARIEQILERRLLDEFERDTYFIEFLAEGLLRGDQKARSEYYTAAITNGWMSRNEVRVIENLNPVDGGDEFLTPLNMSVVGAEPQFQEENDARGDCGHNHALPPNATYAERRNDGAARQSIQRSYIRVLADALQRVIRRERNDILKKANKTARSRAAGDFGKWLEDFYRDHAEFTRAEIEPAMMALAEAVGAAAMREIGQEWQMNAALEAWLAVYIESFAGRHSARQLQELQRLLDSTIEDDGDIVDAFTRRFDDWQDPERMARAATDARTESVRLGQGFARVAFAAAGVTTLVWVAVGDSTCPYCSEMDGKVVGIEQNFLNEGDSVSDLSPNSSIAHPPLHLGCDCMIVPGE